MIAIVWFGFLARLNGAWLFRDGVQWCVLRGDDLQSGNAGFGETPGEAWFAFRHDIWEDEFYASKF